MSIASPSATRRAGACAILARAMRIVVTLAGCLVPARAWSQATGSGPESGTGSAMQPELRADFLGARTGAMQLAAGMVAPAGDYLRLGGDLGAGVAGGAHGPFLSSRADFYGRFHLDPRAESRWAPYLVAGGSFRADAGTRGRLYALAAVGAEGPASHPIVPAFELGFGGGVRAGVVLRRGMATRR
jgi:hypothetical protein